MKLNVVLVAVNAVILAAGILLIVIPSIIFNNYWPFMSVLVFALSLVFPFLCNGFDFENDSWSTPNETAGTLGWLFFGIMVTIGYSIPFELWRASSMSPIAMGLAMGGGTVILGAVFFFGFLLRRNKVDFL